MTSLREDVRHFLQTRRGRLTPEEAGIVPSGGVRRVPGLRREEVAMLAGVSVDYYTRLEKGNLRTASDQVLDAIATALRLDEAERTHLYDLARAARGTNQVRTVPQTRHRIPENIVRVLNSMILAPALMCNGRLDILAANPLAQALYQPVFDSPARARGTAANFARFRFLDPASRDFYPEWGESCQTPVAILRFQAGKYPHDRALAQLVGELSTRSEKFRTLYAAHDVRLHASGIKRICHPVVGNLSLDFNSFTVDADQALRLTAYSARPDTRDAEMLALLASYTATPASNSDNAPQHPARSGKTI